MKKKVSKEVDDQCRIFRRKDIPPPPTEYDDQCRIFLTAEQYESIYPELKFIHCSLSGIRLPVGLAVKAKKGGNKKGIPDIFLPLRRGGYAGLYIELKRVTGGKISKEQGEWREFLIEQGYQHYFCYGFKDAWDKLFKYLEGLA